MTTLKIVPFPSGAAKVEMWDATVLSSTVTGFATVADADEFCKGWFLLSEQGTLSANKKAGINKFLEMNA